MSVPIAPEAADRPRLSLATVAAFGGAARPDVDPRDLGIGQVHLGLGAFHRAHQEVCTADAVRATGDTRWGVLGVTQRSARVVEQLAPQDCLYGVLNLGPSSSSLRLIPTLREAVFPGRDTARVVATIAASTTHVVTLTVTEKGYRRGADGLVDLADSETRSDVAALASVLTERRRGRLLDAPPARTAIGLLARGLAERARWGTGPVSVVSCDNLSENGPAIRALVDSWLSATPGGEPARRWVADNVTFPSTMVDRIVPATTEAHRRTATEILGLEDRGLVVGEPYLQWIIEDAFAGARPAWEAGGAVLTEDVRPYEHVKLRILNGAHSALAYLGALRGHPTIADAIGDETLARYVRRLVDEDVLPSLVAPEGLDLAVYRDQVFDRFANPAIRHTTTQVAMDGSQKLPQRLLATARARLSAGTVPHQIAYAVGAWIAYLRAVTTSELVVAGSKVELEDPLADALAEAASGPASEVADRMLGIRDIFGDDLAQHRGFRDAVAGAVDELSHHSRR